MSEDEKSANESQWKMAVLVYRIVAILVIIGVIAVWGMFGMGVVGVTIDIALIASGGGVVLWLLLAFVAKNTSAKSGLKKRDGFFDANG